MKSSIIIICSDFIPSLPKNRYDFAAVEKGFETLEKYKIEPKFIIGDFDSINKEQLKSIRIKPNVIKLPIKKDITDGEAAILKAIKLGYKKIVLCASGSRLDHKLNLIKLAIKYGLILYFPNNRIEICNKNTTIKKSGYKYISFFTNLKGKTKFSATNLKYEVKLAEIKRDSTLFISNEITTALCEINIVKGELIIVQSND